jgi:dipeptide/tripeptide permease
MIHDLKQTTFSQRAYLLLSIFGLIALVLCLYWASQASVPFLWSKLAAVGAGLCAGLIAFVRRRKRHGKLR